MFAARDHRPLLDVERDDDKATAGTASLASAAGERGAPCAPRDRYRE
jgi:hypothetical protein